MLTFETLLVQELQKQQSRAEFCDIVLHTQGISVPVHSCVLSAFSPQLCGVLSTMPMCQNGQRRQIDVQSLEVCTLLSLVSLLYSGQYREDEEKVKSAACKLGITIPQQQAVEQSTITKDVLESQTETASKLQEPVECADLTGPSSCRSDQGLYPCVDDCTITLTAQGNPVNMPFFQVMDVVPEATMYPTVSGLGCLQQVVVCPTAAPYQQPPPPLPALPQPSTYVEPLSGQGQSALDSISEGEDCVLHACEKFENNIPGFINYFFDGNISQDAGQRAPSQRGKARDIITEGMVKRERKGGVRGGFATTGESINICKRKQNINRYGKVARATWMGQGGARVGRILDSRQVFKNQGRLKGRQNCGGMMKEEGKRCKTSSRARSRQSQTGSRGRLVDPVCQNIALPPRRRGRPRKHPVPQLEDSQNISGLAAKSDQKPITHPAPSMMHTVSLPAANQIGLAQPMDWLIDDVIAQLPFTHNNQEGITSNVTVAPSVDQSRTQTSTKITDFSSIQPQSEGELTDILDSFLRTFEQHVEVCDADVRDGMMTDQTYGQSAEDDKVLLNPSNAHATSMRSTTQGSILSLCKNKSRPAHRSQKPFGYWQVSSNQQSEGKPRIGSMTRSQSRKRKFKSIDELFRENEPLNKQRRKGKKARLKKPRIEASLPKQKKETRKSSSSVASTLWEVVNTDSACKFNYAPETLQKTLDQSESSKLLDHNEHSVHATKELTKSELGTSSSQSVTKEISTDSFPALSAFGIMTKILENQGKKEEEQNGDIKWTVKKQKESDRLVNTRRSAVKRTHKTELEHIKIVTKQSSPKTNRQKMEVGSQMSTCLQQAKDCIISNEEQMKNTCHKATFETIDSSNESPFQSADGSRPEGSSDVSLVWCALDPTTPLEKLHNTPEANDGSDDDKDVDVLEVSSSSPQSFSALPVCDDIILSTEEMDSDEIDVISI